LVLITRKASGWISSKIGKGSFRETSRAASDTAVGDFRERDLEKAEKARGKERLEGAGGDHLPSHGTNSGKQNHQGTIPIGTSEMQNFNERREGKTPLMELARK